MRNKMITLDPTAYEYASGMPNFSQFVRNCIHDHMHGETLGDAIRGRQFWKDRCDELEAQIKELKGQ